VSEVSLGTVETFSGGRVDVILDDEGDVTLRRRDGRSREWIFTPPEQRKLRELLDRAAMPGQRPAADGEYISPTVNYEVVDDSRGRMVDVGADFEFVEIAGHKVPLPAARELATGLAASIAHCEAWLAENRGDELAAMPGQPGAAGGAVPGGA
jgi:hypothetical protein